jgi:hypothetical protein
MTLNTRLCSLLCDASPHLFTYITTQFFHEYRLKPKSLYQRLAKQIRLSLRLWCLVRNKYFYKNMLSFPHFFFAAWGGSENEEKKESICL